MKVGTKLMIFFELTNKIATFFMSIMKKVAKGEFYACFVLYKLCDSPILSPQLQIANFKI